MWDGGATVVEAARSEARTAAAEVACAGEAGALMEVKKLLTDWAYSMEVKKLLTDWAYSPEPAEMSLS